MKLRFLPVACAALAVTVGAPRPAWACEMAPCEEGWLLPGDGAEIPANAAGLVWQPDLDRTVDAPTVPGEEHVLLARIDGDDPEPIEVALEDIDGTTWLLRPNGGFVEGATYQVAVENFCLSGAGGGVRAATFTAGAAAALPASLGVLAVGEPAREPIAVDAVLADGGCVAMPEAVTRGVALVPAEDAAPWVPLLVVRRVVDGRTWAWFAPGIDTKVYRLCEGVPPNATTVGLAAGDHTVEFEARLPGAEGLVTSDEATFTLACGPDDVPYDPDAGLDTGTADGGGAGGRADPGGCAVTATGPRFPIVECLGLLFLGRLGRTRHRRALPRAKLRHRG